MNNSTTTASERADFRSSLRDFFTDTSPETRVREVIATDAGIDEAAWRGLATDLGVAGLLIPEEFGGQGMGMAEMAVALEEASRALAVVPLLATGVLAPIAIQLAGDVAANAEVLPSIADGSEIITLALLDSAGVDTVAREENGWSLYGSKTAVLNAGVANRILVVATTATGTGLFLVDAKASGLVITAQKSLDLTRSTSQVTFEGVAATRIGGEYSDALKALNAYGRIAVSAELMGMSEKLMEVSVEYAKTRVQFGKPIGAFQAIKHRCSEMFSHVESMRAAVETSSLVDPADSVSLHEQSLVVKAYCARFAPWVAEATIQVHGGIGFTWEHCAHLYLRRVKTDEILFGDALDCRNQLQQLLGLTA